MFEPPLLNQALGTGAVVLGFISAGILAHQLEKQKEDCKKSMTRKWLELVMNCLKWGVRLNVRKSVRISVESLKALPTTTNRLKDCDLSR